jgi:hypothetical protein
MKYVEFKEKLKTSGLSEEDFSTLTNTPMPTIRGWAAKRSNKTPKWVSSYLDLYETNRKIQIILEHYEGQKTNGKN